MGRVPSLATLDVGHNPTVTTEVLCGVSCLPALTGLTTIAVHTSSIAAQPPPAGRDAAVQPLSSQTPFWCEEALQRLAGVEGQTSVAS
jgi:hypothetical protein